MIPDVTKSIKTEFLYKNKDNYIKQYPELIQNFLLSITMYFEFMFYL